MELTKNKYIEVNKVDKNEYRAKLEEINDLVDRQDYKGALEIVETIDWRRVRSARTLCMVGEIYEAMKKVYDTMREKHILAAFKTIYRAVVLALNPRLEDFYNITGMTEADKDKVLAVARKFDLGVIVTAPGSDRV